MNNASSRRRFLTKAAWAATTPWMTRAAASCATESTVGMTEKSTAGESQPARGWIDAHVHVWTDNLERYPLAPGYTREAMQPASFTPDELFSHCRPWGVTRIVLIQMSYYGFDNRYLLDTIERHPGVFAGVAVIDATHPRVAETMREMKGQGVSGFRLYPGDLDDAEHGRWFAQDGIHAMWRTAADTGQAICLLINPGALSHVDRMCAKYPRTTVVIDHMARIGMDGQLRTRDIDALCRCARHAATFVKVSAFYALGRKRAPYTDLIPLVRTLHGAYGAERLMWASDCPFQVANGHTYRASIDLVATQIDFLSDRERAALLAGTAQQVFFAG